MKYFAYGIDLDMRTLVEWTKEHGTPVPDRSLIGPASLANHRLCFPIYSDAWQGGVADVAPAPGKQTAGVLFDVSERSLKLLDRFFGESFVRTKVHVNLYRSPAPVEAITYQSTVHDTRQFPPSDVYLDRLTSGAYAFGLSTLWIMQLQSFAVGESTITAPMFRLDQLPDLEDLVLAPPAA